MTDIRRTLLWVVFTLSLLYLYDAWNRHTGQPSLFHPTVEQPAAAGAAPGSSADASLPTPVAGGAPATAGAVPAAPAAATAAAGQGQPVTITTDVFRVTLNTLGGEVSKVELLKYKDHDAPDQPVVLLDNSAQRVYLAQTGYIAEGGGAKLPNHFTVMTAQPGERTLADGQDNLVVTFESPDQGGAKVIKTYTFHRGSYEIDVKSELVNTGTTPLKPQLYLQLLRDGNPPPGESHFYFTFTGPAIYTADEHFQKIKFDNIKDREPGESMGHATQANNGYIAMVQHYFTSAWLVPAGEQRQFRTAKVGDNLYTVSMVLPQPELAPGGTDTQQARLYIGPQEENKLAAMEPGLELVKDYGWLHVLSKPLFWLLDHLHNMLHNWGWSIVALVVILKAAFFYLNASAYKSQAKMKKVAPRITAMRERLKDKPQEMQQEMMRIYREEKINPIGGCLPILLQMPFFIALYWVLLSSVEMRNAPWIGWITDLSAPDPYFILPVAMTLTSLFQVWLNPTPPDPMQAKMMWIMPLAFSFMFFFFPAGLVLYWFTNNALSIAQQWFINRKFGLNK